MANPDQAWVAFLQWALPQLRLRWPGFRKPRRQVWRRMARRCVALGLGGPADYRAYLDANPDEWKVLDGYCRVSITRFRRDHSVWQALANAVLPALKRPGEPVAAWSCGCASGEEAGTLSIVCQLGLGWAPDALTVVGTDVDEVVLERARRGRYPAGATKELSDAWRSAAFEDTGEEPDHLALRPRFRAPMAFVRQDVRREAPDGPFDLVFCRNLAFTYFDDTLQRGVLDRLVSHLRPGGALITGRSERLPVSLDPWVPGEGIWRPTQLRA